jgi:hypothetical protein
VRVVAGSHEGREAGMGPDGGFCDCGLVALLLGSLTCFVVQLLYCG